MQITDKGQFAKEKAMANKLVKRCSVSSVIREMHSKNTMSYHASPAAVAEI